MGWAKYPLIYTTHFRRISLTSEQFSNEICSLAHWQRCIIPAIRIFRVSGWMSTFCIQENQKYVYACISDLGPVNARAGARLNEHGQTNCFQWVHSRLSKLTNLAQCRNCRSTLPLLMWPLSSPLCPLIAFRNYIWPPPTWPVVV